MSETTTETKVPETVVETTPAPEITVETPVQTPIEEIQAKPAETILGKSNEEAPKETAAPATENKTEETGTKAEGVKETEGSKSDEPAPLPTYDAFIRPDGTQVENDEIIKTLSQFETSTKADHAEVQKLGQSLIDLHHSTLSKAIEGAEKSRQETFEKQKNDWKDAFISDPEIGGNRQNTTVSAALEFIRTHGGTKEQQVEFHNVLESTGLGNHPAMIRMLANASRALQEGKPLPGTRPALAVTSKIAKRYGTT